MRDDTNSRRETIMATVSTRYKLLSVADTAIALLLTFPLTCMYWRGIWDLIGYYVLPTRVPLTLWIQTTIGLLQLVGLMLLPLIGRYLNPARKIEFWICTRVFMYIHTLTYMFYWHGFWELLNYHLPMSWQYNVATLVVSLVCLVLLGGCRSTMWPPFFITIDTPDLFTCANRFGSQAENGTMLAYLSDAFVAQIIVLGTAIIAWRSSFNIQDVFIFPGEKLKSDATSAVAGLIGSILLLCLQRSLGLVSIALAKWSAFLKVVWEDTIYVITFIILSLLWRGVWNLNAEYLIKELPLGGWVHHAVGTLGLMAMQTFGEVSAFGMIRDGTDPGGEAFYPVQYLRYFLKKWYTKGYPTDSQHKGLEDEVDRGYSNIAFVDVTTLPPASYPDRQTMNLNHGSNPHGSYAPIGRSGPSGVAWSGDQVTAPNSVTYF